MDTWLQTTFSSLGTPASQTHVEEGVFKFGILSLSWSYLKKCSPSYTLSTETLRRPTEGWAKIANISIHWSTADEKKMLHFLFFLEEDIYLIPDNDWNSEEPVGRFLQFGKYISNTICNSNKYIFQCAMKSWWGGWQVGFMGSSPSPPPLATTPSSYSAEFELKAVVYFPHIHLKTLQLYSLVWFGLFWWPRI